MFLRPQLFVRPPLLVQYPVKATLLAVAHHAVEKIQAVPRVADVFLAVGRRKLGKRRGRPSHPRLVDQKTTLVRQQGPVPRHILVKTASLPLHRQRIRSPHDLIDQHSFDLLPQTERSRRDGGAAGAVAGADAASAPRHAGANKATISVPTMHV